MNLEYFQLIDRITDLSVSERRITVDAAVPLTSTIFEGHFPGHPLMPGVLLIEAMAQSSGWLVIAAGNFSRMPFLAQVKEAKLRTFVGMVEGCPGRDDVMAELAKERPKRVVLKPLMVTAGDHAHNDLNGDRPESWRRQLEEHGYQVRSVMDGLGDNDAFAALYAKRIADTAAQHGIELKTASD